MESSVLIQFSKYLVCVCILLLLNVAIILRYTLFLQFVLVFMLVLLRFQATRRVHAQPSTYYLVQQQYRVHLVFFIVKDIN